MGEISWINSLCALDDITPRTGYKKNPHNQPNKARDKVLSSQHNPWFRIYLVSTLICESLAVLSVTVSQWKTSHQKDKSRHTQGKTTLEQPDQIQSDTWFNLSPDNVFKVKRLFFPVHVCLPAPVTSNLLSPPHHPHAHFLELRGKLWLTADSPLQLQIFECCSWGPVTCENKWSSNRIMPASPMVWLSPASPPHVDHCLNGKMRRDKSAFQEENNNETQISPDSFCWWGRESTLIVFASHLSPSL